MKAGGLCVYEAFMIHAAHSVEGWENRKAKESLAARNTSSCRQGAAKVEDTPEHEPEYRLDHKSGLVAIVIDEEGVNLRAEVIVLHL